MTRVTHDEVRAILTGDEEAAVSAEQMAAYIAQAGALMSARLMNGAVDLLPTDTMKEVERNLAAHYCVVNTLRKGYAAHRLDDASVTYATNSNAFLTTAYGQQAIALDATGSLASQGQTETAFHVL